LSFSPDTKIISTVEEVEEAVRKGVISHFDSMKALKKIKMGQSLAVEDTDQKMSVHRSSARSLPYYTVEEIDLA
jgi:hypothetical protein